MARPTSSSLQKPMMITKLKVVRRELMKTQSKQPDNIAPTENFKKRRITNTRDTGQYELRDKRDIRFLDPGTIKIETRLRHQLNKSLQRR